VVSRRARRRAQEHQLGVHPTGMQTARWARVVAVVFFVSQMIMARALLGHKRAVSRSFVRALTSELQVNPPEPWNELHKVHFSDAFNLAHKYLEAHAVPESDTSARYLLCDVVKTGYRLSDFNRAALRRDPPVILTSSQLKMLEAHCLQRAQRVPVQYILGNWDFFGMQFECEKPVLIPRPETEELVEHILSSDCLSSPNGVCILDVGSGTGAIGIALLSQLQLRHASASCCVALDINPTAAALATRNAAVLLSQPSAYRSLALSFADYCASGAGKGLFDVVVSNPPYIPSDELAALEPEVANYEDPRALHGGIDGLDMVRELLRCAGSLMRPHGPCEMWLEVARGHPDEIETCAGSLGWQVLEKMKDLTGNPRFIRLKHMVQ